MIDLRSDTVTRPTPAMREAMAGAEVGDDVYGEDPTVRELEARAADLVGKEAALFVPSGTMGNQVAALTHAEPGQTVIAERESHVLGWELGGLARLGGLQPIALTGDDRGALRPADVADELVEADLHRPGTGLVCLENTHNLRGGRVVDPEDVAAVAEVAHERDVPVHLDGARLFNAAVALDVPASAIAAPVDSVMFCLSKGLGAPAGSMLAGDEAFVDRARRNRKLLGGGMRQVGILAAAGLLALEGRDGLEADHVAARRLAEGLAAIDGLAVTPPETNIVLVDTEGLGISAEAFVERCAAQGVRATDFGPTRARFCTHRDVDVDDVEEAVGRIGTVVHGIPAR